MRDTQASPLRAGDYCVDRGCNVPSVSGSHYCEGHRPRQPSEATSRARGSDNAITAVWAVGWLLLAIGSTVAGQTYPATALDSAAGFYFGLATAGVGLILATAGLVARASGSD